MARPKGSPNKLTADVKDKLQLVMDDVISSLNISTLTTRPKNKDVTDRFTVFSSKTKTHFK